MSHFAVIAPPLPSHYRVLQALGLALVERGHRVTFIQQADAAAWITDDALGFFAVGHTSHPPGSLQRLLSLTARPSGPRGLRRLIEEMARSTTMLCRELPAALSRLKVDALLCDQMEAAGGLIGAATGLPWVSIACALPVNREPGIPLPVMHHRYSADEHAARIYAGSERVYDWLMTPHRRAVAAAARALSLPPRDGLHECLSPFAQISQTTAGFDFPRQQLPPNFYPVGPLRRPRQTEGELPYPVDPARPLVFVSLGTLLGQRLPLFRRIVRACKRNDVQVLLAHCGGLDDRSVKRLLRDGADWVTDFAPQQAALARADAVICHGGLNTVLDAVASRTPVLALPLAFDHPGAAARVLHAGIGLRASARFTSVARLSELLRRLLNEPSFGQHLATLGAEMDAAGGTDRAVAIIEQTVGVASVTASQHA